MAGAKTTYDSSQWGECTVNPSERLFSGKSITPKPVPDAVYIQADKGNIQAAGISTLSGDVIIQQNDASFNADKAQFDRRSNLIEAQGHVIFSSAGMALKSDSVNYNLEAHTGTINQAEYVIGAEGAHGKSARIIQQDKNNLTLKNATFTTCPIGIDSWFFRSSEIKLNRKKQIGTAKNVTLKVGKVPVFYFPWLNFPLNNQRLSGFLAPSIRLQSNAGISIPYYWNIAPNYDATFTLTSLKERGLKLDSEFRYLTRQHQGIINYDFIPKDHAINEDEGEQRRHYFNINHVTTLSKQTHIKLHAEGVSDRNYFDDFSSSLEDSSRSALQRRLEITNNTAPWKSSAAIEDYQVIDINDAPYSKLPELTLSYAPEKPSKAFKLGLDAEYVYFDKDSGVTGSRANLKLKGSKKWGTDAWYFKPSISLNHTLYVLNGSTQNQINRTLPTLTLDTGLFFDREFIAKSKPYTQTLEPRIFYTHTPFKDQSKIPIFDTALRNFSTSSQLFSENRFTGKDRIADTNQITFAVTSRIQDRANGNELFKASIGQVYHFDDNKVTLPGSTLHEGKRSDLVLELSGRLNENFRIASTTLWNHEKKRIPSYELRLNYQDDKKRIANISFRQLDTELKQLSFSGAMPLNNKWSVVTSIDHDIKNSRNLEALAGIEYQDCCWKTRLVVKRYLNADNESYETPVFLEFELKGLGNIGTGASRELKDKIYGYDDY